MGCICLSKTSREILVSFFDLSMSLNCSIFMPSCGKKGGDSNGSLMVAVPETANTTEYGGTNDGCNIHHSNTGNQLYVPVVQRKQ